MILKANATVNSHFYGVPEMFSLADLIKKSEAQAIIELLDKGNIDPKELTEDLILPALKQFQKDVKPIFAILNAAIAADIKISEKTYEAVIKHPRSFEIFPYISKIIWLNEGIVNLDSEKIISGCSELQSANIPVSEAFILKAIEKFGCASQESIAIINTFIATGGQISREAFQRSSSAFITTELPLL